MNLQYLTLTVSDLFKNRAAIQPNKIAVCEEKRTLTFRELEIRSDTLACYLINQGVEKGDRIGVFLDKSIESVISIGGITKAGGIFINIDPKLTSEQVMYRIKNCSMSAVITSDRKIASLQDNQSPFIINIKDFNDIFRKYQGQSINRSLTETDLATILYTSGSTGMPKGAVLSHRNLVLGAELVATYLENSDKDIIISVLPFNFDYGLNQLLTALLVGATLVLQRSMFPNDICQTLIKQHITGFAGVPSIWIQLLQDRISSFKKLSFPDLRYITNSGGSIPVPYLNELRKVLKNSKIYLMYGLTEAFRSTYLPPEELEHRPTSIGKAIPDVQISVINKNGKECQPGEEGELVHRGGVTFQGYWNNPEATAKVLKPSPFSRKEIFVQEMAVWSGDIVKKDAEGYLYFIGRNDEMMKCLGYRISPQEIEEVLYRIEQIKEVVVFGIKDDLLGDKIKAVVSLKKGGRTISEEEILDLYRDRLPEYMVPREIEIVTNLPKTMTGKIDRARIKKEYGHTNQ